jgi:hypothetical protein
MAIRCEVISNCRFRRLTCFASLRAVDSRITRLRRHRGHLVLREEPDSSRRRAAGAEERRRGDSGCQFRGCAGHGRRAN